jgi:ABC-type transport system involved in cytochrome c biogenesis permease subunit
MSMLATPPRGAAPRTPGSDWIPVLYVLMPIIGVGILFLTWVNFSFLFQPRSAAYDDEKIELASLNYEDWYGLPVLHGGRIKPFESACKEMVRQITGANQFKKLDSVGVVLTWMCSHGEEGKDARKWDDVKFVLCGHEGVRSLMYHLKKDGTLSDETVPPEYLEAHFASPNELRQFREGLFKLGERDLPRYEQIHKPLEQQLNETFGRLFVYEQIVQNVPPTSESGEYHDPLAFVALDKVAGSPWFSLGELRSLVHDAGAWEKILKERVEKTPQLYLSEEHQQVLQKFKDQLKRGDGSQAIDELSSIVAKNREDYVERFIKLRTSEPSKAEALFIKLSLSAMSSESDRKKSEEVRKAAADALETRDTSKMAAGLDQMLRQRDQRVVQQLRDRLPGGREYRADDPRYRMLHLGYLETRYPDLYEESVHWQKFNKDDALTVLGAFHRLQTAYQGGNAGQFDKASERFFATVQEVSEKAGPYPGSDTVADRIGALLTGEMVRPPSEGLLQLELTFNRVKPFQWAWITMLAAVVFFCVSLGHSARLWYALGFTAYGISLAFQLFGFSVRMLVSGRPPITNMYETVVWVALMSAVFALVLELLYRKKVIALAGAIVATIALVLANTLPVALDPKISPLTPVLRSNFWLTIHVITIVSGYAAGTLAWGLGNISLTMILFGKGNRETVKVLGQFTYRALQLAVLGLAAGTFLGGWWAAYSWGRFWGWDPKETGALIALLCYVIPLHMRYVGWVKDFGLAVSAIVCYIAVLMSWYGVNFLLGAGLHSYGFGGGGASWVFWAILINLEYLCVAALIYHRTQPARRKTSADAVAL